MQLGFSKSLSTVAPDGNNDLDLRSIDNMSISGSSTPASTMAGEHPSVLTGL